MPQQIIMCLLGEDDLKIMKQLINNIHETGEWPKDVTEVSLKEAESYKMQRLSHNQAHRSYSKDSSEDT